MMDLRTKEIFNIEHRRLSEDISKECIQAKRNWYDGKYLEQVNEYGYLEALMNNDGMDPKRKKNNKKNNSYDKESIY